MSKRSSSFDAKSNRPTILQEMIQGALIQEERKETESDWRRIHSTNPYQKD